MGKFRKKLPYIPVQPTDQTAEFAGWQWVIEGSHRNDSWDNYHLTRIGGIFKDSIIRLLYSNFIWYGLEDIEARTIEHYLITAGSVVGLRSNFNLEARTPSGIFYGQYSPYGDKYDFYGVPQGAMCSGRNGLVFSTEKPDDFVIGWDTTAVSINSPSIVSIYTYVARLAEELDKAYQALQVAVETHKQGIVFYTESPKETQILQNTLQKISGNNPFIIVQGNRMQTDQPVLFAPNNTQVVSQYYDNFQNAWSMVMDIIGLEHSTGQKKERLIVDEANQNNSLARYIGGDRLRARKRFAEELNKKFGLNVRVENYLMSIAEEAQDEADKYGKSEEGESEDVHSSN